MKLKKILEENIVRKNPPKYFVYYKKILEVLSIFDDKLNSILMKFPLLSAFIAGLVCRFSFFETEISSCLAYSIFIYFKILYNFYQEGKTKKGLLLGFIYGFGIFSQLFSWFLNMHEYGIGDEWFEKFMSIFSFCIATSYLTLSMTLTTYLSLKFAYDKISLYLYFSFLYTFFEVIQGYFLSLSPFVILSYGLAGYKYFIQFGSIIGSFGLTFLFLLMMSLCMIRKYYKYSILIFVFCSIYGIYKVHIKNNYKIPKEKFDITVVQTNFSEEGRHKYYSNCCNDFAKMSNVENIKNPIRKKLIIAPETLICQGKNQIYYLVEKTLNMSGIKEDIRNMNSTVDVNEKNKLKQIIENKANNIIICTGFYQDDNKKKYNSYQFFSYDYKNDKFNVVAKYYKKYLVPLGEKCPYVVEKLLQFLSKYYNTFSNIYDDYKYYELSEGDGKNTIYIDGVSPFAMNLCSDIIPPGVTLYDSYIPTWILSTMNFHVFNSDEKTTFLARLCYLCGKYRAIEFNRPNVMCINFGYSCILDCLGYPLKILDPKKAGIIEFEMPMKYDVSLYSIWRNYLLYILMLFLFVFLYVNKKKRYLC